MATTDKVQAGSSTTGTSTSTSYTYSYPEKVSPPPTEYGWACPRCNRINAPWVRQCDCSSGWNNPTITWTYPNKDSHDDWWSTHVTCEQADSNTYTTAQNPVVGGSDYWDQYTKTWTNVPYPINKKE